MSLETTVENAIRDRAGYLFCREFSRRFDAGECLPNIDMGKCVEQAIKDVMAVVDKCLSDHQTKVDKCLSDHQTKKETTQ